MIPQTIAFTVFFSALALLLRPGALVGLIAASSLLYPEYLRIPMGISEMSAPRIVAIVGIIKVVATGGLRGFHFTLPDGLILATYVWSVTAQLLAGTEFEALATHIGRFFDTVLMYFAARWSVRSIEDLRSSAWILGLTAVTMGSLGAIESATQYSPYAGLDRYRSWVWILKPPEFRMGFLRAQSSASHSIYFGMGMCALTGLVWSVSKLFRYPWMGLVAFGFGVLGCLSSMSSGPLAGIMIFILLAVFEFRPSAIKPALLVLALAILLTELVSNRHFYSVIDRLTFSGGTAWYRGRLLEVGLSRWYEYWLVGVGPNKPDHWGMLIDGRKHVDLVNHFLLLAVYGGFLYPLLYLWTHSSVIRKGVLAFRARPTSEELRVVFGLSASIIAVDIASFTVGIFGPVMLLLHMTIGLLVSVSCTVLVADAAHAGEQTSIESVEGASFLDDEVFA